MNYIKRIISGAALGTILGSLASFLYPRRNEIIKFVRRRSPELIHLSKKAREYGESLFNNNRQLYFRKAAYRNQYLKGGLLGLLVGAGAALFVAPKSGKPSEAK